MKSDQWSLQHFFQCNKNVFRIVFCCHFLPMASTSLYKITNFSWQLRTWILTKNFIDSENMLPHFWSFFIKVINFQPRDVCNGSHWTREPGQHFVFNSFSQNFFWIILPIINGFLFLYFFENNNLWQLWREISKIFWKILQ